MWRTRAGATDALRIGGAEGLHELWTMVQKYDQGWAEAKGPAHVIRLEIDGAGAEVLPLFDPRIGDVTLRWAKNPPALIKWHLRRALLRRRQDLPADRLYNSSQHPALTWCHPGPK